MNTIQQIFMGIGIFSVIVGGIVAITWLISTLTDLQYDTCHMELKIDRIQMDQECIRNRQAVLEEKLIEIRNVVEKAVNDEK